MWVPKVRREVSTAVGVPAAVGSVEQEATLSKSLCQLPVKVPCLTTGLEVWGTEDSQQHAPGGRGWRGAVPWGYRGHAFAPVPCGGRAAVAVGAARSAAL